MSSTSEKVVSFGRLVVDGTCWKLPSKSSNEDDDGKLVVFTTAGVRVVDFIWTGFLVDVGRCNSLCCK